MQSRSWASILVIVLCALVLAGSNDAFAKKPPPPPEPETVFSVPTKKKLERVHLLGDEGELVFMQYYDQLYAYDGNSGEKLWDTEIPKYEDTGLDLIWNEELFITTVKKGMICYNLRNGEVLWQTETELRMKDFLEAFSFRAAFVLRFEEKLMSFYPQTGELLWEAEELFYPSRELDDAGYPVVYGFDREFGGRLLLLEDLAAYIYDAANGDLITSIAVEFTDENPEPILTLEENGVIICYSEGTTALDLKDGGVRWKLADEVDPKRPYITFENSDGDHFAAFGFKYSFATVNLDDGELLWDTNFTFAVRPQHVSMINDTTLFATGIRKSLDNLPGYEDGGSTILASAFDMRSGEMLYEPVNLVYTRMASVDVHGIVNEYAGCIGPFEQDGDVLFYVFADDAKSFNDPELKQEGGEGLVRLDPMTGEVKWRNDYVLYDIWNKQMDRAGFDFQSVNEYVESGFIPQPVFDDTSAYISTGEGMAKLSLATGDTLWTHSEYDLVQKMTLDGDRLFGPIGFSHWDFIPDGNKGKAEDAIYQTKRGGYFVLNATTGEQVYSEESRKNPTTLFLEHYDPESKLVYLSDGETLQALSVVDSNMVWTRNIRKDKDFRMDEITGKDGVVFVLSGVEANSTLDYTSWRTVETPFYDVDMKQGIFPQEDGTFLVVSTRAFGKLNGDGSVLWRTAWKWESKNVDLGPTILPAGMLFKVKNYLRLVSLEDGSTLWQTRFKTSGDVDIKFTPNKEKVFLIDKKQIVCIRL
ncbi:PQQ-like beta-propeller repeat protein [bacterium]|nr:PQQ-like beta-propeller repeat protein [bacterium]